VLRFIEFIRNQERWFFFLFVAASCSVFFLTRHFVTLDGPAHLYNAGLLAEMIKGNSSLYDYYEFNSLLIPNWMGHFFLSFFQLFLPGEWSEKLFLVLYVFAFSYSFRFFVRQYDRKNGMISILILPFVFSTFLYFGFYNFSIAFVFLFRLLGVLKKYEGKYDILFYLRFSGLLLCIWYSHITVFVFALLLTASLRVFHHYLKGMVWKKFLRESAFLFIAVLPGVILTLLYKQKYGSPDGFSYLPVDEIHHYFYRIQSFVHYTTDEGKFNFYFFWFFVGSIVVLLFFRISARGPHSPLILDSDILFILAIPVAILCYVLPDSDSKGGYIIIRMNYMFYLLIFSWIATQRWNSLLQMISVAGILLVFAAETRFRTKIQLEASRMASDIYYAAELLPDQAVVLPVQLSSNWVTGHYSNYLGADKPVIILENYEAAQDYFPLRWKANSPASALWPSADAICLEKPEFFGAQYPLITHVFILHGDLQASESCKSTMNTLLQNNAELKYSSQFCSLYELR